MKKLIPSFLIAFGGLGLAGCEVEKEFSKTYEFEIAVPVSANGSGQVEDVVVQEVDMDQEMLDITEGAMNMSKVNWIRIQDASISLQDADNENNAANFSHATVEISDANGRGRVSGGADIPNEYSTTVNLGNAFGEQNLYDAATSNKLHYKVIFDARRATTKELPGKLQVKLLVNVSIPVDVTK